MSGHSGGSAAGARAGGSRNAGPGPGPGPGTGHPSPGPAIGFAHRDPDAIITGLAARQHGVVGRRQLIEAGVAAHRIEYRLKRGRLEPLHRGVYRVGPVRGRYEKELAAVLASGASAVLSHGSAGAVWGSVPALPEASPTMVSVPRRRPRDRPGRPGRPGGPGRGGGVRVHSVGSLGPDEVTEIEGLPITTPARTLLDLASRLGARELERAVARSLRKGLANRDDLERLLARYPRRPGSPRLRSILGAMNGPALTRSEAEARFLSLMRKARLPAPEVNVSLEGYEVDFLWRAERLVTEIDGFTFHGSREMFERDRHRDGVLTAAGFRVVRVTWRQLSSEPEALLARVAQALAR